jgi:hypothetical protein
LYNIIKIEKDFISNYSLELSSAAINYNSYRQYFRDLTGYPLPTYFKYNLKEVSRIPAPDFYSVRQSLINSSVDTNLYPIAVRYVSSDSKYLIERPPFQISVDYRLGGAHSGASKVPSFKIWVPWTETILDLSIPDASNLSYAKIFFNDTPLYSLDDHVIPCDLPNSYANGAICFSNSMNDINSVLDESLLMNNNVAYIYNYVFNNYMMGGWNSDLTPVFYNYGYTNGVKTSDLPMFSEYANPSPERKNSIIDSFEDSEYKKLVKRILNSKVHFTNFKSLPKVYFRDLVIRSSFTLEETLQYVTDIKTFLQRRSQASSSFYQKRSTYSMLSLMNSPSGKSSYVQDLSSSVLFNSIIRHPEIEKIVSYPYSSFTGNIVIPIHPEYMKYTNTISNLIEPSSIAKLVDQLVNSSKNNSSLNFVFNYQSYNSDYHLSQGDFHPVTTSLFDILQPYFEDLISKVDTSKVAAGVTKSLSQADTMPSVLQSIIGA